MRKRDDRKRNTANDRHILGHNVLLSGWLGAPAGSLGFRSGPLCPMAVTLAPIFRRQTNTRRVETAESLGIADGGLDATGRHTNPIR